MPKQAGVYRYTITGCLFASGTIEIEAGDGHGLVIAQGQHFTFEDGTPYFPFGTTVYALAHQPQHLIDETLATLSASPFNKIRTCVFLKDYAYNHNEPLYYPFEKNADSSWDVNRPCLAFWDHLEQTLCAIGRMEIQVDLILFHPYDRWGFSAFTQEENLIYLDYLLRRFAAYPFLWWSLANEYDLCIEHKTVQDFEALEEFVAANDPYHHLLSNHNCFAPWDFSRSNITHVSYQTKSVTHVAEWYRTYQKPVVVDECCYEGNLPYLWGCISGQEMTARFWGSVVSGGYCTHGETFLDENEIIWWSKGGKLRGESPARIAFLKSFVETLPGPIEPLPGQYDSVFQMQPEQLPQLLETVPPSAKGFAMAVRMNLVEREVMASGEYVYRGKVGSQVHLVYLERFCPAAFEIDLPECQTYRVEVIDTWEMTRKTVLTGASGKTTVPLPGKPYMAIAAFAE
ncbi:MAG: DUF4038 domain-containing protein [Clostridiales bacterium]|nr:DUF4038 domain-containing protein [Clostridiales bacterium]